MKGKEVGCAVPVTASRETQISREGKQEGTRKGSLSLRLCGYERGGWWKYLSPYRACWEILRSKASAGGT